MNACVYCGETADTKDHLLPRSWTGEACRSLVRTVPACHSCNTMLNDVFAPTISERAAVLAERINRRRRAAAIKRAVALGAQAAWSDRVLLRRYRAICRCARRPPDADTNRRHCEDCGLPLLLFGRTDHEGLIQRATRCRPCQAVNKRRLSAERSRKWRQRQIRSELAPVRASRPVGAGSGARGAG